MCLQTRGQAFPQLATLILMEARMALALFTCPHCWPTFSQMLTSTPMSLLVHWATSRHCSPSLYCYIDCYDPNQDPPLTLVEQTFLSFYLWYSIIITWLPNSDFATVKKRNREDALFPFCYALACFHSFSPRILWPCSRSK